MPNALLSLPEWPPQEYRRLATTQPSAGLDGKVRKLSDQRAFDRASACHVRSRSGAAIVGGRLSFLNLRTVMRH
jgi:hypothetical protein